MQHRSDELLTGPRNLCASENSSDQCLADPGLSGKVVVSVADAGETAVVVSMLEGKQETKTQIQTTTCLEMCEMKAPFQVLDSLNDAGTKSAIVAVEKTEEQEREKVFSSPSISEDVKMHESLPSSNKLKLETLSNSLDVGANSVPEELKLALSEDSSDILPSSFESAFGDKGMSAPSNGSEIFTSKLLHQHCSQATLESGINHYLGLFLSYFLLRKESFAVFLKCFQSTFMLIKKLKFPHLISSLTNRNCYSERQTS